MIPDRTLLYPSVSRVGGVVLEPHLCLELFPERAVALNDHVVHQRHPAAKSTNQLSRYRQSNTQTAVVEAVTMGMHSFRGRDRLVF